LWQEIKDEIKPQLLVTIVFFVKLLISSTRDEIRVQRNEITNEIGNWGFAGRKDEIEPRASSA
jgi:hypothetical protein